MHTLKLPITKLKYIINFAVNKKCKYESKQLYNSKNSTNKNTYKNPSFFLLFLSLDSNTIFSTTSQLTEKYENICFLFFECKITHNKVGYL